MRYYKKKNDYNFTILHYSSDVRGDWLLANVLPKLRKWFSEMDDPTHSGVDSLRLVSLEAYNNLYQELKNKYVPNIAKVM